MEMERKNSQNSGKRAMLMAIFTLAWPTMLEQLLQTAVQYIDTGMVGSLGTRATAAVGSTGTVSWMLMSIMMAIGVGMLAYISQAFGAREPERAKRASGQAALLVLATGAVLTVIMMLFSRKVPVWMRVEEDIQDLAARYFFILCTPMIFRSASIIFGMVLRAAGDTKRL